MRRGGCDCDGKVSGCVGMLQVLQVRNEIYECERSEEARNYGMRLLIYIMGSTAMSVKRSME